MSDKSLQFKEQTLVYNFSITGSNPRILIKKIVFNSLLGQKPNEWGNKLYRLSPFLQVTFFKVNGYYAEAPVYLDGYISPNHYQPIIEFFKQYPDRNNWEETDIGKFDSCKVEITYTKQQDAKLDITIFYDAFDMQLYK